MNKSTVFLFTLLIPILITNQTVNAETTTTAPTIINSREPTDPTSSSQPTDSEVGQTRSATSTNVLPTERQLERQENRQEQRLERQVALTEVKQQRILNLSANLSNRLEAAIVRLFQIAERLESRLVKLEASGVDITSARTSLQAAAANLTAARALMINIDTEVTAATTSNTPGLAWRTVKERYAEVATLIRSAYGNLRQATAQAKNAPPETGAAANAEVTNNPNLSNPTISE